RSRVPPATRSDDSHPPGTGGSHAGLDARGSCRYLGDMPQEHDLPTPPPRPDLPAAGPPDSAGGRATSWSAHAGPRSSDGTSASGAWVAGSTEGGGRSRSLGRVLVAAGTAVVVVAAAVWFVLLRPSGPSGPS